MGFLTGGLIFKNSALLSDETILATVRRENYGYADNISMEAATSADFNGTAIARTGEIALVLNRDITHSCSFEEQEVSKLDERLAEISRQGDVMCFLMNTVSDTYAWSLFREGRRVRGKSAVGGQLLSDFGRPSVYEKDKGINESVLIQIIESFTGLAYVDLIEGKDIQVKAYFK